MAVLGKRSVHQAGRLRREQLLYRGEDAEPRGAALDVAGREQRVRPLRCPDRRVGAVLVDEELGRAPDVEITGWQFWFPLNRAINENYTMS